MERRRPILKRRPTALAFSDEEIDALILGLRLVMQRGDEEGEDEELCGAAETALARIAAALPAPDEGAPPPTAAGSGEAGRLALIRAAIRSERKLQLRYTDRKGAASVRVVWPVAVGDSGAGDCLAAWCEARGDFRHFRLDRIVALTALDVRLPTRHRLLMAEWRLSQDANMW